MRLFCAPSQCSTPNPGRARQCKIVGIMGDSTIEISRHVMFQEVSGETVLLDLESEQYFGLDEVGTRVWTLISEGTTAAGVVERLLKEYEVDRPQLEIDVNDLLQELAAAGLIRLVGKAQGS